jgi:hypothetical protein
MSWDELLARPRHRGADGALTVLEEVDDDTGTAVFRRAGASHRVGRPGQLEVPVLDGELVEDEPPAPPPGRARLVAASVAAAGLALLAVRRRA